MVRSTIYVVKAIEAHLGKPALVPPQPQYVRALDAALFARRFQQEGGAMLTMGIDIGSCNGTRYLITY